MYSIQAKGALNAKEGCGWRRLGPVMVRCKDRLELRPARAATWAAMWLQSSNVEDISCQDLARRLTVTSVHRNCGTCIPLTPLPNYYQEMSQYGSACGLQISSRTIYQDPLQCQV